ncbi:MAG TPA: glycosyltransferase family 4 protein [Planctomycetota bacterium]|nr:glycosyltransferase family 4 protein [Planctomycetota bacterium]
MADTQSAADECAADFIVFTGVLERARNPLRLIRGQLPGLNAEGDVFLFVRAATGEAATRLEHLLLDDELDREAHAHAFDEETLRDVVEEICRQNNLKTIAFAARDESGTFAIREPLAVSADAAAAHLEFNDPALLVLLHASPFKAKAGGTENHVLDRVRSMKLSRAILVYPSDSLHVTAAQVLKGDVASAQYFTFALRRPLSWYLPEHAEAQDLVLWIARLLNAGVAAIEHLYMWPHTLPQALREAGIPYTYATHDFFAVCPSLNLVNPITLKPCSTHYSGADDSAACLKRQFEMLNTPLPCDSGSVLKQHQARFSEILRGAAALVFPSESARRRMLENLHLPAEKTHVIPHGCDVLTPTTGASESPREEGVLRVAMMGMLAAPIKGSELILELLSATREMPLEWHLFGVVDANNFRERLTATGARLVIHGAYGREDIVGKLQAARIDVALFTSIAEETFSYTLSEAWLAGVPAIVPALGALKERVEKEGHGWIIEPHSAAAAKSHLQALLKTPARIDAMRERLKTFSHTSCAENAAAYREIFSPLLQAAPERTTLPERYLERCSASERRARQRFLASTNCVFPMEKLSAITALDQCSVSPQNGVLLIRATGNDPSLLVPQFSFVRGRPHMLRLELSAPYEDTLQVFYSTRRKPGWSEEQSEKRIVRKGRNELILELSAGDLNGLLRVDPGSSEGDYILHAFEIRAV